VGIRASEPEEQCSPCLPHLEPDTMCEHSPKTGIQAPAELTQADAEGEMSPTMQSLTRRSFAGSALTLREPI
jgi:hypothetical protein